MAIGKYTGNRARVDSNLITQIIGQSPTVFGNQIICVAVWHGLNKVYEEFVGNTTKLLPNSIVNSIIQDGYGANHKISKTREAWCASFIFWIMNEAGRTANCNNDKYPTQTPQDYAKHWWSALKFTDFLAQRYSDNKTIVPGCAFYRFPGNEQNAAVTDTGHMGIVIGADANYFYTVEGNTDVNSDGKRGVGIWCYPIAEAFNQNYGFRFIHIENDTKCINLQNYVAYKGTECIKRQEIKQEEIPTDIAKGGGSSSGGGDDVFGGSGSGSSGGGGGEDFGGSTTTEKPKEPVPCKEVVGPCIETIIRIPDKSRTFHRDILLSKEIAGDITDANYAWKGGIFNGVKAKNYPNPRATRFGIVRDESDNMIWILDLKHGESNFLLNGGYISPTSNNPPTENEKEILFNKNANIPDAYILPMYEKGGWNTGNGMSERKADVLRGTSPFAIGNSLNIHIINNFLNKYKNTPFEQVIGEILRESNGFQNINIKTVFKHLRTRKLDKPVILLFPRPDINKNWNAVIDAIGFVMSVIPAFPSLAEAFPKQYLEKIQQSLKAIRDGKFGPEAWVNLANGLLPASVKGFIKDSITGAGEYITAAARGFEFGAKDFFEDASKFIGLDGIEISKLNDYLKDVRTSLPDFSKILPNNAVGDVIKRVTNYTTMTVVKRLETTVSSGSLLTNIIDNGITGSALMREIFQSGSAPTILSSLPSLEKINATLFGNSYSLNGIKEIQGEVGAKEFQANMTKAMFGFITQQEVFDGLTLESIYQSAKRFGEEGKPFVLPSHIQDCPDIAECYKVELEKRDKRIKIVTCPPGYEYDFEKNVCKSKKDTVFVSGYEEKGTSGGGGYSGGDYYSGGNYYSGGGFYSGGNYVSGFSGSSGTNYFDFLKFDKDVFNVDEYKSIVVNSGGSGGSYSGGSGGYSGDINFSGGGNSGFFNYSGGTFSSGDVNKRFTQLPPCVQQDENGYYFIAGNYIEPGTLNKPIITNPNELTLTKEGGNVFDIKQDSNINKNPQLDNYIQPELANTPFKMDGLTLPLDPRKTGNQTVEIAPVTTKIEKPNNEVLPVLPVNPVSPVDPFAQSKITNSPFKAEGLTLPLDPRKTGNQTVEIAPVTTKIEKPNNEVLPVLPVNPVSPVAPFDMVNRPMDPNLLKLIGPNPNLQQDNTVSIVPTGNQKIQFSPNTTLPVVQLNDAPRGRIQLYVENQGLPTERWFAEWEGKIYDFDPINCKIFIPPPVIKTPPDEPPVVVLPPDKPTPPVVVLPPDLPPRRVLPPDEPPVVKYPSVEPPDLPPFYIEHPSLPPDLPPRRVLPPVEPPGECDDCELKKLPAMIEERKKTIFSYPPSDYSRRRRRNNCDDCCDDCDDCDDCNDCDNC